MSLPAHSALMCNLQDSPNHSLFEQNACEASETLSLFLSHPLIAAASLSVQRVYMQLQSSAFITTYSCTDTPKKAQMLIVHSVPSFQVVIMMYV
jgi:hypothetical protein